MPDARAVTPRNLASMFFDTAKRFPSKKSFFRKLSSGYAGVTYDEAALLVASAAGILRGAGVGPGDRVAILSENRPEWAFTDLAALSLGACTVPIYPSLTPYEVRYILEDSGAKVVAVSSRAQLEKIVAIRKDIPSVAAVIAFDAAAGVSAGDLRLPMLKFPVTPDADAASLRERLESEAASVAPDALASVIYTSGTTGPPKGVMLTHSNFLENAARCERALVMGETDAHLSFLPLCHVFERLAGYYLMVLIGASISYAESLDTVPDNIRETKPTFLLGVPRFYEKTRDRVLEAVKKAGPLRKGLFFWAKELGEKRRAGARVSGLPLFFADRLVYKKFQARLGGRIRFCVSGGAPLSRELGEFFADLGVLILEGYGLTETSPVMNCNREENWRFGSVGLPLEGIQVRIAEDGEIVTAGPCVMKGYYNKPAETAEVLKDGWFHTGDLGRIDPDGFLWITGRKKDLIITSGGKKVPTRQIEEIFESDPYILRCVLFGDGRRFLTALIVPRQEKIVEFAASKKIAYSGYAELLKNPSVHALVDERIEALSRDLANYERIKYFAFLENDFTQASGELTPTLKVKRDVVLGRYKELLLPFYSLEKGSR